MMRDWQGPDCVSSWRGRPAQRREQAERPARLDERLHDQLGNHAIARLLRQGPVHAKSRLSQPGDAREREADAVADAVVGRSGRVPRPTGGAAPSVDRKCASCAAGQPCNSCDEREALPIARKTDDAAPAPRHRNVEAAAVEGAAGVGRPLDELTRARFESSLDADLGDVRIHTDARAAASARALAAEAFTVGSDVVFAAGRFDPGSLDGQHLLAHELAHVLQHRADPASTTVARFAEADVEVEEEALELPGGVRYASPYNNSYDAMAWRGYVAGQRQQSVLAAERPNLVIERGGHAPDFTETTGTGSQESMGEHEGELYDYTYTYQRRSFYAISALEYDVAAARTEGQLASIYASWFQPGTTMLSGRLWLVTIPGNVDLELQLMPYFMRAVRAKVAADPSLANSPLVRALNLTYVGTEAIAQGPCYARDLDGHLGGNSEHNSFATTVTGGNPNDFFIRSPEGWGCATDGRDLRRENVLWEVKVGHDWASDAGVARGSIDSPRVHTWMLSLEAQRITCAMAAARCGYQYRYAVDNYALAEALNSMWGGTPPVSCFNHDGTPCRY